MKSSRRKFLKIAGLSALTLGVKPVVDVVTNSDPEALAQNLPEYQHTPEQLKAKHWGMVIDTRKFESPEQYEKIIEACHSFHNVPDIPGNQNIKWIWTTDFEQAFTDKHSHFPSKAVEEREYLLMCNHCEYPPCVRACPTKATFKRESDGIVIMDMHRCIGCRFCMAACPFGARSFNFKDPRPYIKHENPEYPTRMRGVVEKCNFCAERLAKGENPACVDAAAEVADGALIFGDLADPESNVRQALSENFAIRRKTSLGTQPSVYYII